MKARALRLGAGLPENLWPWIIQTAGYLMNRTPMKKHAWKTPHEMILATKPNLAHLRKFGCKAYSLDKKVIKSRKLMPRAHIGHLVGYDSTNIFLIWIPSQHKVIRTRDVMFDEKSFYDKGEVDLMQLITEPMIEVEPFFEVSDLPPPISKVVEELSSDSDEEEELLHSSIETSDQSKGKQKASEPSDRYLPSSSLTPSASKISDDSSPILTPEESSENSELPRAPPPPKSSEKKLPKFAPSAPAPRNISSNVDDSNVLSEGTKRTRQPRKQAYAVALDTAGNGGNETFHGAFSAHINANQYYVHGDQHKSSSTRLHRDSLPPEPKHFGELKKHPHADGFKRALEVELAA